MAELRRSKKPSSRALDRKRRELSREKLIVAAVRVIDERGAAAVTMRALADAVGVTPMALYNHFSSKRNLLVAVADHLISNTEFDGKHGDWRDQIRHCFQVLRNLCLRHPGLPGLLEEDGAAPASVFAPMEVTLRALAKAGLDDLDSVRAFFLLVGFTLSQSRYEVQGPIPALEPSEQVRRERIAGRGYAATERLELPATWDFNASFAFGISLVLKGVEATASQKPASRRPHRRKQT